MWSTTSLLLCRRVLRGELSVGLADAETYESLTELIRRHPVNFLDRSGVPPGDRALLTRGPCRPARPCGPARPRECFQASGRRFECALHRISSSSSTPAWPTRSERKRLSPSQYHCPIDRRTG